MTVTSSRSTCAESPRRRRGLGALVVLALATALAGCGAEAAAGAHRDADPPVHAARPAAPSGRAPTSGASRARARGAAAGPGVTELTLTFVDHSRTVRYPGQVRQPRRLVTIIRYPTHADGPLPLIVFGHGFAVTPAIYFRLLRSWAQAGYVVAAPVFPVEAAGAPGGPNESDLVNQPRDMSFVMTSLLARSAARGNPLSGRINSHEIGVSGQSDGGETALAVAYDRFYLDRRIRAAVILSGAEIPNGGLYFPRGTPPLLATQGTADVTNLPVHTYTFFARAHRPKYLLSLLGAAHLPPYTFQQPYLSIVGRVSTAFFNLYLKGERGGLARMHATGNVAGAASLTADP